MKQYHEDGEQIWNYIIKGGYRCDCGCNVFHQEYNRARNKIWYICNACNCIVGEVKDEYLQENLSEGIWK